MLEGSVVTFGLIIRLFFCSFSAKPKLVNKFFQIIAITPNIYEGSKVMDLYSGSVWFRSCPTYCVELHLFTVNHVVLNLIGFFKYMNQGYSRRVISGLKITLYAGELDLTLSPCCE